MILLSAAPRSSSFCLTSVSNRSQKIINAVDGKYPAAFQDALVYRPAGAFQSQKSAGRFGLWGHSRIIRLDQNVAMIDDATAPQGCAMHAYIGLTHP